MQASLAQMAPAERKRLRAAILRLAWPVVGEQLLGQAAQVVDMMLVGRLGAVAVAAVGLSNGPYWFITAIFAGVSVGVTALVARYTGAKDDGQVQAITRQAHWLGLFVALTMGTLVYFFAHPLLVLLGAQPETLPVAVPFLRAWAPGLVALGWSFSMNAALRGTGDTRTPMLINLGMNVTNGLLGFGLIYGHFGLPAMGLLGGGIGLSIARTAGALALLVVLLSRQGSVHLRGVGLPDWARIGQVIRVGWPASLERGTSTIAYLCFAWFIARLGTDPFAAHQIAVVVENTTWFFAMGLSTAAATLVGQNLGAGDPSRADLSAREAMRMALWVLAGLSIVYVLLPLPLVRIFTQDTTVAALAAGALRIGGLSAEIAMGMALVMMGALQGAGDTRPLWRITLLGGGIVRIALIVLAVPVLGLGLNGAWAVASVDWWIRSFLFWRRFRSGAWQRISI